MELTNKELRFVHASGVLTQLKAAGAFNPYFELFEDGSCTLVLGTDCSPGVKYLAEQLLSSVRWSYGADGWRLTSCCGLH